MTIVMGMDQHRAQISAEWIDTITGEISRARIAPADRAAVRTFLGRFTGEGLEVALEATTGWRFVVEELERIGAEVHLAEPAEASGAEGQEEAREDRLGRRPASAGAVADRPAAGVVDRAGAHPRSARPGPDPASALASADRVAAADARGALSPRVPAAAQPAHAREARVARRPDAPGRGPRAAHDRAEHDRRDRRCSSSRSTSSCARTRASSPAAAR